MFKSMFTYFLILAVSVIYTAESVCTCPPVLTAGVGAAGAVGIDGTFMCPNGCPGGNGGTGGCGSGAGGAGGAGGRGYNAGLLNVAGNGGNGGIGGEGGEFNFRHK